jgi:hypothetical protein
MRIRTLFLVVAVAIGTGWAANDVFSQDEAEDGAAGPDQAEVMQKWQEFMTPAEPHAELAARIGKWAGDATMYESGTELTSRTTYERTMILGGRYMVEDVEGSWSGMPFQGRAIVGFDNHRKEYFSVWIDSFGTSFMLFRGKADENGTIHMATEPQEDFLGRVSSYRVVTTHPDDDTETFEMFHVDAEGKEALAMKMTLKREGADAAEADGDEPK